MMMISSAAEIQRRVEINNTIKDIFQKVNIIFCDQKWKTGKLNVNRGNLHICPSPSRPGNRQCKIRHNMSPEQLEATLRNAARSTKNMLSCGKQGKHGTDQTELIVEPGRAPASAIEGWALMIGYM